MCRINNPSNSIRQQFIDAAIEGFHPVLRVWFDVSILRSAIGRELDVELARVDDHGFGAAFQEFCPIPGMQPREYCPQILDLGDWQLLAGIRFRNLNRERPFVDVFATSRQFADEASFERAIDACKSVFRRFRPQCVRMRLSTSCFARVNARNDTKEGKRYLAGRVEDIAGQPLIGVPGAVDVRNVTADEIWPFYEPLYRRGSALHVDIAQPESFESLKQCEKDGGLFRILYNDRCVGVLGLQRGQEFGMMGWCVTEIVIDPDVTGLQIGPRVCQKLSQQLVQTGPKDII